MSGPTLPPVPARMEPPSERPTGVSWRRLSSVLCPVWASLGTLALVAWTVAPSVTFGDSGELVSAAATLGVPHPPGYPLWTLLAHLATHVLPFANPAASVNMLSALFLGLAGLFAYLAFREFSDMPEAALVCSWGFCLTPIVWDQGTTAEVYTLDLALLALGVWMLLRLQRRARDGHAWTARDVFALGLVLGAGITHRATHAVYQVTYLLALLCMPRSHWLSWRRVAWFGAGMGAAFCLWAYLPLRGGAWSSLGWGIAEPSYTWGPVASWHEFAEYISARQYSHYMWAAGPRLWDTTLAYDLRALSSDLSPVLWIAACVGAVVGWRHARERAVPFLGVALVTWLLFWNYIVIDPEVFFVPLLFGVSGLAALGTAWAARRCSGIAPRHRAGAWLGPACLAAPLSWLLVGLPSAYREVDRSRDTFADEYASSLLDGIPSAEADVIVGLGHGVMVDYQVFPPRYFGWVLGYGSSLWWWFVPEDDDAAWRQLVERLGATGDEASELSALPRQERPTAMVDLALRRGRVYSATGEWISRGGAYEESIGWLSAPRRDPPAAPADMARAEPWLERARRWVAARPDDRGVTSMAFAPIASLADEFASRGRPDLAAMVLSQARAIAPADRGLAIALARQRRLLGDPDGAASVLREARARADRMIEWHDLSLELGHALHEAERWEESAEVLEDVIARRGAPGLSAQGLWPKERGALADCYAHLGRERDRQRVLEPLGATD